jgi:hypothetical protein
MIISATDKNGEANEFMWIEVGQAALGLVWPYEAKVVRDAQNTCVYNITFAGKQFAHGILADSESLVAAQLAVEFIIQLDARTKDLWAIDSPRYENVM